MVRDTINRFTERRTFLKGAAAAGAALVGASGSAAAQPQNLQIDADNLVTNNGLLTITLQNTNVLNNVDVTVEDIEVTIQDITVTVTDVIDVGDVNVLTVDVSNVLNNSTITALNNVDVQVSILSDSRQLGGSETVQVINR